jgi:predicted nucleic acid-binding protein
MKILLDTDTCIHLIQYQPAAMLQRLKRYTPGDIGISSITLAELSFGAAKDRQQERNERLYGAIGDRPIRHRGSGGVRRGARDA